jgi:uncharacterized protein
VTTRHDYLDDAGGLVGIGRMRLLKFKPPERKQAVPESGAEPARPAPKRPRPAINEDNAWFWEGVDQGELRLQRCASCGELRHPPTPMCGTCQSTETGFVVASGAGSIHSYVIHHHPPLPGVTTPHPILLVDLEEGVRIVTQAASGTDPAALEVGLPVALEFEQIDDELTLPVFRLGV